MEALAERYASREVEFAFVYTREAHPGEKLPHHTSVEQKRRHAHMMSTRFGGHRRMLVDDLQGTLHRGYGGSSNSTFVVARGGRVAYRANWTDPRTVEPAVEMLFDEDEQHSSSGDMVPFPYFVEWQPRKFMDRVKTMQYLREVAGERAADEFAADLNRTGANAMGRILQDLRKS